MFIQESSFCTQTGSSTISSVGIFSHGNRRMAACSAIIWSSLSESLVDEYASDTTPIKKTANKTINSRLVGVCVGSIRPYGSIGHAGRGMNSGLQRTSLGCGGSAAGNTGVLIHGIAAGAGHMG